MTDGLSLSLQDTPPLQDNREYIPPSDTPTIDLTNFAIWIEIQPVTTIAGILDVTANELYRRELYAAGNEIKHVVTELRV